VIATVQQQGASAKVKFGAQTLSFTVLNNDIPQHETFDFAALAMAAFSMSHNIEIDLSFPISKSMAQRLIDIRKVYGLWSLDTLAPLRVNATEVVDPQSPAIRSGSGVICLSGGLDSLSAAISAIQSNSASHALLIAGADYRSSQDPGFLQLKDRVERLSSRLKLETLTLETNVRQLGINWDMLHGFNLGACLHFLSPLLSHGSFAQDDTNYQQRFRGPWGNFSYLPNLMSTEGFDVRTYGEEFDRVDKLRHVVEFDERLLSDLSVCFADKTQGGNCGRCFKCVITRAGFHALGISQKDCFVDTSSIAVAVRAFRTPRKMSAVRGRIIRCSELLEVLPDGDVREAFVEMNERLHKRHDLFAAPL
jgi:hypothetical protein